MRKLFLALALVGLLAGGCDKCCDWDDCDDCCCDCCEECCDCDCDCCD